MHLKRIIAQNLKFEKKEFYTSATSFRCTIGRYEFEEFIDLFDGVYLWVVSSLNLLYLQ